MGAAARARDGDLPDQLASARELVRVIAAKSRVRRSSSRLHAPTSSSPPSTSGPGPGTPPFRRWPGRRGAVAARGRATRDAEEPGVERTVERLEVLAAGDQRLPQGPVHVVLPAEIDRVEASQGVGDPARPDFESALSKHAPEKDDVPDDGVRAGSEAQSRAVATSPASASSRIESRSSWYLSSEPSVACTFSTSSSC